MALVPIRIDRTSKPPLGTPLRSDGHWSVEGLVGAWAFNEGAGTVAFDGTNTKHGAISGPVARLDQLGYHNDGTAASGLCTVKSGSILGGLQNSSVLSVINTTALASTAAEGAVPTYIGTGGNTIYCERATSGNDIYKLCAAYPTTGENSNSLTLEFTYRNDAGVLLQRRMATNKLNNGVDHVCALTKVGTAHQIFFDGVCGPNTTAYGSSSTAFTNAGLSCTIGFDVASTYSAWNGLIKLVVLYCVSLSPTQVASLSVNPWQIYEPEIVWIEVPDGAGGTAYTSSADAGTVTLTGSATTNYHAYVSSADTGSVTLTGSTTSDYRGLVSHADTGTVTITGNAATDYRGLVSHAGAGSVILAGSTSTDYRNLVSSADTSTVTLTGYAATDTVTGAGSYTSIAAAGTITLTGSTATDYRTLISGTAAGTVTLTGFAATDTITEPGAYTSEAAAGTITLTGSTATDYRSSAAASSAIQLVGSEATGYFGFTSGAEPSAVIITGAETSVLRTWISDAIPGSIVIHGYETSGISPIYEISKIFATARLSGPSATGRITTPTTGIRLT